MTEMEVESREAVDVNYVYENRRYVPRREIIAYIFYDIAQTFNINSYRGRFNLDVLHISLRWIPYVDFIGGIWDTINDVFIAGIVDKTRTRWGKFKPYLVLLALPTTIGVCLFWLLPFFFPDAGERDITKFVVYFALAVVQETVGTFQGISRTGILATISPHPVERVRLITMAQVLSFGDKLPELVMSLCVDLVNSRKLRITMRTLYAFIGCSAAISGGIMSLVFALIGKERIMQSVKPPSIRDSVKSILNNKPVLLMTLSDFLSAFSVGGNMRNYYMDVLGKASLYMVVGIPGSFVSTPSYAFVPWARRKFSTRTLWIAGSMSGDVLMFFVFLFGSIGGVHNGMYKRTVPMVIAIAIQETLFMTVYGVRRVIPEEMYNEAMDYCEWKNGYRTEAMTGVAKNLAQKLVRTVGQSISSSLLVKIGYNQQAGHLGQTDQTKYALFAMATALPLIPQLLSLAPKLLYDLSGKKREEMYADLLKRREREAKAVNE